MGKKYDDLDEYKRAVLSDSIKSNDIMENITLPECVYKYRRFDPRYLEESLNGNMFFSNPAEMNVNDSCDCKIEFKEEEILKTMFPDMSRETRRKHPEFLKKIKDYKKSLQGALRVGCFTSCDCSQIEMWDNPYFGDKHKGYCIKYKVDPAYFYPGGIVFLKILYDNNGFDATDLMKNFVEWNKLDEAGEVNSNEYIRRSMKLVCLAHNHTLFKPEAYKNEEEWRIIISNRRYLKYFGKENVYTRDFSSLMQAVYLGSEFRNTDKSGEMYECAVKACKEHHIPLYIMQRNGSKLEEKIVYDPDKDEDNCQFIG